MRRQIAQPLRQIFEPADQDVNNFRFALQSSMRHHRDGPASNLPIAFPNNHPLEG
jgi:hypothetical protein